MVARAVPGALGHLLAVWVRGSRPLHRCSGLAIIVGETEVTVVQVHPDADSMLFHMQVARKHIEEGTEELLDTRDFQIYGPPNDTVLGMIKELAQSGVPLIVKPNHLGGFTRSSAT
jgi:hypothetical protein